MKGIVEETAPGAAPAGKAPQARRLAAVDIGTNSIRSIVVQIEPGGTYRILDDEKALVRLGEGLNETGNIGGAAWQRAMTALSRQKKIMDGYAVDAIEAIATSAVRKAGNGAEFIAAIEREVGLTVDVISGEEEAELAASSAFHNFDMEGVRHLILDIGGGSLELITALGNHIEEVVSLELGAVFLTERFIKSDPVSSADLGKLRKYVRKTLKGHYDRGAGPLHCLIGSGGTVTSLAAMVTAARRERFDSIHGYEILRSEVVHLLAMLHRKNAKERRALPGLNPDRADIIVAGVAVIDELMDFFQVNLLKVNEHGIREGIILKGLQRQKLLPPEKRHRTWRDSALAFARSCHFEESHSLHTAKLALDLFQALAKKFKLKEREKRLLEAAALLHDVGYFINYSSHHKHSYHLIRHAQLFGFTPRERELIANIARYHRKSMPKKKHEQFSRLPAADRLLVSRLGGILRLADGMDRRRNSAVRGLECRLAPDALYLKLEGDDDLSVERFGARGKGDLFEAAFKLRLEIEGEDSKDGPDQQ